MKTAFTILGIMMLFLKTNAQDVSVKEANKLIASLINSKADTNKVNKLLELSNYYIAQIPIKNALKDSALLFATEAQALSITLKFKNGVEDSYLAQAGIWMKVRDVKINAGKDGETELRKVKETETSLTEYVKSRAGISKTGEIYTRLAKLYETKKSNFPEMLRLYKLAISCFQQARDKKRESEVLFDLGFTYNLMADLPNAEEAYLQSITVAKAAGRHNLQRVYGTLGNVYTFRGNYTLGLKYELEAAKIAEAEKDTTQTYGVINLFLGLTYEALKDRALALKHYKIATSVFEKYAQTNIGDLSNAASNVAKMMVYIDPKSAITFIETFLQRYPHLASGNMSYVFAMRLMQANMKLKQYDAAQVYCAQLTKILETKDKIDKRSIYGAVLQYFIITKEYPSAKKYLAMFQEFAESRKELPNIRDAHLYWYQIDSAEGNPHSAIAHYIKYKVLNDSILNETKVKEIALLNVQFETDKKDKDILFKAQNIALLTNQAALQRVESEKQDRDLKLKEKDIALLLGQQELQLAEAVKKDQKLLLNKKDINILTNKSLLQSARLKETRIIRNVIVGGAVMLLIVLALVYNQYRVKKQTNKEISAKNFSLQQLVQEKEWLLKEIHHRVKNNLQTVVSLLESQSAYLQNDALLAIQDSQNRVHTMSIIHQKLYQGENVAAINMNEYVSELINYLKDSFNTKQHIHFNLQIAAIELDVSQAVPIGLILNEAVTNAIKYAFHKNNKHNEVNICMKRRLSNLIEITIFDNGSGLSPDYNSSISNGLGMKLMKGLTGDLDGQFCIRSDNGTHISINFTANTTLNKSKEAAISKLMSQPA